jgi:hypothetical protein
MPEVVVRADGTTVRKVTMRGIEVSTHGWMGRRAVAVAGGDGRTILVLHGLSADEAEEIGYALIDAAREVR